VIIKYESKISSGSHDIEIYIY